MKITRRQLKRLVEDVYKDIESDSVLDKALTMLGKVSRELVDTQQSDIVKKVAGPYTGNPGMNIVADQTTALINKFLEDMKLLKAKAAENFDSKDYVAGGPSLTKGYNREDK